MTLFIVLVVYAAYLLFDFRMVAKAKNNKHIWPWLVLFVIGAAVQVMYELKISVPSPTQPIAAIISGLFILK